MREHYIQTNRDSWDRRTDEHVRSRFYDVEGFLAGACSLKEIELAELGDVRGKTLLHLQCHFGMDTLSLARRGARVTGLDFSPASIDYARSLARKVGVEARFVAADVYETAEHVDGAFDIVFTSYGALEWLPDLRAWARVVAAALEPGGVLHIVEFHPYAYAQQGEPYFHASEPNALNESSYTENSEAVVPLYVWSHPIADVVNSLIAAGLELVHLNEFPFTPYDCFPGLVERAPGRYYRQDAKSDTPMLFSIKARKR